MQRGLALLVPILLSSTALAQGQAQPVYVPAQQPAAPPQYVPPPPQQVAQPVAPAPQQAAPQPAYAAPPAPAPQAAPVQQPAPVYAPPAQQAPAAAPAPAYAAPAAAVPVQQAAPVQAPPVQQAPATAPAPAYVAPAAAVPVQQAAPVYAPPAQQAPAAAPAPAYAAPAAAVPVQQAAPVQAPPVQQAPAAAPAPAYVAPAPAAAPVQQPAPVYAPPAAAPVAPSLAPAAPAVAPAAPSTSANELIVPQYGGGATATSDDALRAKLPPAGPGRELFLREMLHVMPRSSDVYIGTNKQQLSAAEFYRIVGRADLISAVHAQQAKRGWLYLTSALFLGAGIASGIVVMNNAQDLNDPACFSRGAVSYNSCVDSNNRTTMLGAGLIAGGAIMGGLFFTLAATTSDMVTSPDETAVLAAKYNQSLSRKLTSEAPKVEVTPVFGKGGGGLAAVMRF